MARGCSCKNPFLKKHRASTSSYFNYFLRFNLNRKGFVSSSIESCAATDDSISSQVHFCKELQILRSRLKIFSNLVTRSSILNGETSALCHCFLPQDLKIKLPLQLLRFVWFQCLLALSELAFLKQAKRSWAPD